jgi:hypothetical protein
MQHVLETGEVHTGFWWGNRREGDHLEDAGVDEKITLKQVVEKLVGGRGVMDWIDLVQDSNRWRAFVNSVMNLRVP